MGLVEGNVILKLAHSPHCVFSLNPREFMLYQIWFGGQNAACVTEEDSVL